MLQAETGGVVDKRNWLDEIKRNSLWEMIEIALNKTTSLGHSDPPGGDRVTTRSAAIAARASSGGARMLEAMIS